MRKTITLEGGKAVDLAANAATPFRFKQLFNTDLLKIFKQSTENEEDQTDLADVITQMAYIMNRQAEGADMNKISMDDFYTWLEDYEPMDFITVGDKVVDVYMASAKVSVEAKKK